jgi:hypothetical protein
MHNSVSWFACEWRVHVEPDTGFGWRVEDGRLWPEVGDRLETGRRLTELSYICLVYLTSAG